MSGDLIFMIPLNREDLLKCDVPGQYVVRNVLSLREVPGKIQESLDAQATDGCAFILEHFDTFFSILDPSKQLDVRIIMRALRQIVKGINQLCETLPGNLQNGMHSDLQQKILNICKMLLYVFEGLVRILEDQRSRKDLLIDNKMRKKNAKNFEEIEIVEDKTSALVSLHSFLQLPLHKLWDPPTAEEEFVNLASNICYKLLEDVSISSAKMKPFRERIFQILGCLITRYQHGLSCTVKIVQLLKLYEHLCSPLGEGVVILVRDYGCRGFIREVIREISVSDSVYDTNGVKSFSVFLSEIAKNAPDLVLPIMSLLLPHLDNDPYTMRNCVLEIMGEIVIQSLSSESQGEEQRETRDLFLNHLQDHLLDNNAHVRCKAIKTWQRLAQEGCIPVSRYGDLLVDVVIRLGDNSWSVVRYAVQLVKIILENNPFGAKMDAKTVKDRLEIELKCLDELKAEANNIENMSRSKRWETILPDITLAVEEALQAVDSNDHKDSAVGDLDETAMMAVVQQISCNISKGDYKAAFHLMRSTEKIFPGAADLRKNNALEWQVDYFLRLMKKIYVDMDEQLSMGNKGEDKENKENVHHQGEKEAKKTKRRRLQDLHQDDESRSELSEAEKALVNQTKVVQFLQDSISFSEEMLKAVKMISSLLHCGQVQVIQDAIDFLTAASLFGFEGANDGIRQMLLLVWSGEQVVKETVAAAYKTLYLQSESGVLGGRARGVQVVHNLCKLLNSLSENELAALEILVKEWVACEALDKACIQVMWERFTGTLKDTTPQESHAALQLLCMVGGAKTKIIETNLDVMIHAGFGVKGERNFNLIRDTCRGFLKLVPIKQNSEVEPLRFPPENSIFTGLVDIIKEGFCDIKNHAYQKMAEEAVEVIYQLSERPDVTCGHLLKDLVNMVIDECKSSKDEETQSNSLSTCSTEILSRLIFFVGHISYWQWIHLDKSIFRELKRRNQAREQYALMRKGSAADMTVKGGKKKKKVDKEVNDSLQNSILSASHVLLGKQETECDEIGGDMAADDAEAEYIHKICESEIVSGNALFSKLSPIVVTVCANPQKYSDVHLQTTASLALTKLMLVSSEYCDQHLQLVFTMMEKSVQPKIRSNLVYAVGDLANRFPNLIEPWTKHIYSRLRDKSSQVRLDTIIVLKHLITNEMVKVRGQISDLALCIVDSETKISSMSTQLFQELSKKGNTLYNVMPDIISRLSNPNSEVEEENFKIVMKYLMQLIQKDRQMESLVDKLCQRFRASTNERQWSDLAYCLGLMQYSDRSLRRLLENLPCYAEKLTVPSIYDTFNNILTQAGRTQKPERLLIVEEIQSKISECLRKGLSTNGEGDIADSQVKAMLPPRTPRHKPKLGAKTASTRRTRGRGKGQLSRKNDSSSDDSCDSDEGVQHVKGHRKGQRNQRRQRRYSSSSDASFDSEKEETIKRKPGRRRL